MHVVFEGLAGSLFHAIEYNSEIPALLFRILIDRQRHESNSGKAEDIGIEPMHGLPRPYQRLTESDCTGPCSPRMGIRKQHDQSLERL